MSISDRLIKIDQGMDYVPLLSTTNNLVCLFIKCVHPVLGAKIKSNRYIAHIKNKKTSRCFVLLVPVVSNIHVYNKDKKIKELVRKIETAAERNVKTLTLRSLTFLPEEIGLLIRLRELQISYGDLTALPSQIGLMTSLIKLTFNFNPIPSLPAEIGRLANLTELNLSGNDLACVPPEIGELTNLITLNLSHNDLTSLPEEIGRLTQITKLQIDRNKLRSLPAGIGELTKLQELDLTKNELRTLPAEIGKLNINELKVTNNFLKELPTEIGLMKHLLFLNLETNRLKALPTEIGRLTQLYDLQLDENRLTSLPAEMRNLVQLTWLPLSHNQFSSFPTQIIPLHDINVMYLDHNPLTSLSGISQMPQIFNLMVSHTPISSLPAELARLTKLDSLNIENCPNLRDLPMALGELPALTTIDTDKDTPVPQRTIDAILEQCQQMRDAEARAILPARLSKWRTYAKAPDVKLSFSDQEICTLNEWLRRLERTEDFAHSQAPLAKTVCALLADLPQPEFRESFFNQAAANNVCCQDRAAMALNEIYTTWLHLCQARRLPEREKLRIIAGVARTLCLRRKLQKLIQKHAPQERETVEIFLYYEIELKTPLKLETAIQTMSYGAIGKRAWIDQAALIEEVKRDFYEDLSEMPLFDQLVPERFQKKLEGLGECPKGPEESTAVLNYKVRQGEIMAEWKKGKIEAAKGLLCQFQIV